MRKLLGVEHELNKKKENETGTEEKSQEASVPVPREKAPKGTVKVTNAGKELFDSDGKLKTNKSAEQLLKEEAAKDPSKAKQVDKIAKEADAKLKKAQVPKPKSEKVSVKNDKYSRIATYSVSQKSVDLEVKLLTELSKIKGLQILPKDSASFKLTTVTGNHHVGIIDTLKMGFSCKVGNNGIQSKVTTDAEVDTVIQDVKAELERISKLPNKKVGGKSKASSSKKIVGKKELIERMMVTDSKKFHMKGKELTKTAIQYAKERKFKITENNNGFVFTAES